MDLRFLLNALFNSKTLGATEIAVNANALYAAIDSGSNDAEILLGAAEVAIGISEYFNLNLAPKIGADVVNVSQLVANILKAQDELDSGPVSPK